MAALKSILSSRVSKWTGHTIATIFLPKSYCQRYSGYPGVGFCLSTGRCIEHETPSLSWSERYSASFRQQCGRRIHRIWTQSAIASGVYCRRKFTDPE